MDDRHDPAPAPPRVSIVVLTHNRPAELARTLQHLAALPEQPPVIVVDNASQPPVDPTRIPGWGQARLVLCPHNEGAAGRNRGVAEVTTPYVAFCDDDTWWEPGALATATALLDADPRVAALSARVLVGPDNRFDPACEAMARSPVTPPAGPPLPGPPLVSFMAGAVVMRTEAFRAVGGYEPRFFLGAEEVLMALDLGARGGWIAYAPQVVTHHHPSAARDAAHRRLVTLRNRLWLPWLRLPLRWAISESRHILREARAAGLIGPVLREALRALPWVLAERRPVPPDVLRRWLEVYRPHALRPAPAGADELTVSSTPMPHPLNNRPR
jgi:GT2 family glycosyltransferase